jgi:ABC-type phosphate transport system substrate-binding protein
VTTRWLIAAVAMMATGALPVAAQNPGYVVIVNESNYLTSITTPELSRLFMKKTTRWTTGQTVTPLDLTASSPVRENFSRDVFGKTPAEVKAEWQAALAAGRGLPPMEAPNEPLVVAFVRANPGAIAYVSPETPLGAGVRAIRVRH